ncbi:KRAB-A domain-containing protein 2-like [Palaemon carinicauda]|uniref:KRAB-A domain-containing protein 2-like n=1 Tax=Palaemon carinicauda TaxID=392227 RepID=UPI0035B663B3
MESKKSIFQTKILESEEKKATNSLSLFPREEYEQVISRLNELKQYNPTKTKLDYRLLQKYEILEVTIEGTTVQKLQKKDTQLRFICAEDVFDVLVAIHRIMGLGGRTSMCKATKEKYANISRDQITLFFQYCEECQLKKSSVRKCVVVKPIVSKSMNSRALVDLIDMQSQPDGKYRFIFNYQDHSTKMICLRALQTKTAEEVAIHLVDIFCDKGALIFFNLTMGENFQIR